AGAAGLTAAIFAARAGARVLLLETRPAPGAKIRLSGGGRANVLPSRAEVSDFSTSGSKHALRKILLSWPLEEVRAFFEAELRIPLKTEPSGKVFPASDRALDVAEALLAECRRGGVELVGEARVVEISRAGGGVGGTPGAAGSPREARATFLLRTAGGRVVAAERVVLATGGLSYPKTGSDGGGLEIARALGHSVRETHPALVPLVASDPSWRELAGIALRARLRAERGGKTLEETEGDFLFTHRGFSGPAVLDLSRHFTHSASAGTILRAAWAGRAAPDWERVLGAQGRRSILGIVSDHLPRRLAERLLALAGVPGSRTASELSRAERRRAVEALAACPLAVSGSEGYEKAEATAGGVPLEEVSPGTLESRIVPRLHLAGEILDAVGRIGGYNFLWAWTTGRAAGIGCREAP
ncbi:MAG: NAD(P)/FAD-dependent oxidoreductase, partial [Planctomycetota bacterium]